MYIKLDARVILINHNINNANYLHLDKAYLTTYSRGVFFRSSLITSNYKMPTKEKNFNVFNNKIIEAFNEPKVRKF